MNLEELNDSQRKAVEYCDGPSLVIAGAGSGKTRVLTYKIAYLIEQGLAPWNILALTFTNKAANEMKQRIGQLVGEDWARQIHMGTFHSVFSRILRAEAEKVGYTSSFTIYDESDSRSLLHSIIKEFGLDDKVYKSSTVHNRISMAKNNIELPKDYASNGSYADRDKNTGMERMPRIYEEYQNRLRQSNAMDFDDLLLYTYLLFNEDDIVRRKYSEKFAYVLVDEYQDTNTVQNKIILQLVCDHRHICVVGDDAQSIYGFRGAKIDNILYFCRQFGSQIEAASGDTIDGGKNDVRLFKLEQNYRSTQCIVEAANSLINHNQFQIKKTIFSDNVRGDKLQLKCCYSDREEAVVVANDIRRFVRDNGGRYCDFAILYRTNAQSRPFEDEFLEDNIPYCIYGGLSFYQRKEIKDILAYFRLVVNNYDEEALRRIINYPTRGIGKTTEGKIRTLAIEHSVSPWEIVKNPEKYLLGVNKGTVSKLKTFAEMITGFTQRVDKENAYVIGKRIISEVGILKDIYSGVEPDDKARQENLEEFCNLLREFVENRIEESGESGIGLNDFLLAKSIDSDLDSDENSNKDSSVSSNKVALMTIHSAKGLEFPTVFIVGMEENIFLSQAKEQSPRVIEEERRLFYVAITRAQKQCILTFAQKRYQYGQKIFGTPSRFLNDIDPNLVDVHNFQQADDDLPWSSKSRKPWSGSGDLFGSDSPEWMSGTRRYQNSRPVASQFKADPKPRITSDGRAERREESSTPSFGRRASTFSGRRMTRIPNTTADTVTGNTATVDRGLFAGQPSSAVSTPQSGGLCVGSLMEHERFGIGTVLKIEGKGENTKATVEFQNCGTKQLLLKFAKFKKLR